MNLGWSYNPDKILAANARMESAGFQVSFSADRPSLKGYWKRQQAKGKTIILAQADELTLNGKYRDANCQHRGTCVGQGSSRAIEDVHISRIVDKEIIGVYTQIAYEPMYGYERHLRWPRTQAWGYTGRDANDGLAGADAAAFYSTIGVIRRGSYGGVDLTSPREDLAINWNNSGVPDAVLQAGADHKIVCHSSNTWDEYADAIAAKCWGHICLPQCFGLSRVIPSDFGTVLPDENGGHDTEVCGIVTLPNHETGFVIQQSWCTPGPAYPKTIQTVEGPIQLRPGSYCVAQKVLEGMGNQVERISCDIPSNASFR